MITNLFRIFDPVSVCFLSLNWISLIIIFIFSPVFLWYVIGRLGKVRLVISHYVSREFLNLLNKNRFVILFFFSLFFFIIWNNIGGLLSYVFTASRHLVFRLRFGVRIWLSVIIYGWINNTRNLLIHLIPQGTPLFLICFMVLIEIIRNIIRPVTLSVRLAANIIAGHLLLVLLRSAISSSVFIRFLLTCVGDLMLSLLELAVGLIQGYVFSVLTVLYLSEARD